MLRIQEMFYALTRNNHESNSSSQPHHRRHGRHRHHRHTHHHHRRSRHLPAICKAGSANFLAATGSMVVIVLLCTALAEPKWFTLHGGGCRTSDNKPVTHIGMNELFSMGSFQQIRSTRPAAHTNFTYGTKSSEVLLDCLTVKTVSVLHGVLSLCFISMLFTVTAFVIDLAGPKNDIFKICQQFAIFNILAVLVCVIINGLCFMASELLFEFQKQTQLHKGSKVEVDFSVSFYLVTAAGGLSIIAASCNLLKKMPPRASSTPSVASDEEPIIANDFDSLFPDDDLLVDHRLPLDPPSDPPPYSP